MKRPNDYQTNNDSIRGKTLPFVSVVIPVFNGSEYLEEAVESIQRSTYRDFEVLLIDDGSSDTSKHICHNLEKKYPNVRFFDFTVNRGLGRVLNFALKNARGKYICRLNQDDRMLPNRIETQVRYLQSHPQVTAVGSWIRLFENNGNEQILKFLAKDADIKSIWYLVSPFSDPSVMYRKDMAVKVGGYVQAMWPADDTHLWYRMGMAGKLANIQKPLVEVRWHEGAASVKYFRKLAVSTYRMHRWTLDNVGPASPLTVLYWLVQLAAGYILPPQINWNIYRYIKRLIAFYEDRKDRLAANRYTAMINSVMPQPKKLSVSGV